VKSAEFGSSGRQVGDEIWATMMTELNASAVAPRRRETE